MPPDDDDYAGTDGDVDDDLASHSPFMRVMRRITVLSPKEARDKKDYISKAIKKYGELVDEGIELTSKTHADFSCWGTFADEECEELADAIISLGRRFKIAAQAARGIAESYSYVRIGAITFPRFKRTMSYWMREGFALSFNLGIGTKKGR